MLFSFRTTVNTSGDAKLWLVVDSFLTSVDFRCPSSIPSTATALEANFRRKIFIFAVLGAKATANYARCQPRFQRMGYLCTTVDDGWVGMPREVMWWTVEAICTSRRGRGRRRPWYQVVAEGLMGTGTSARNGHDKLLRRTERMMAVGAAL